MTTELLVAVLAAVFSILSPLGIAFYKNEDWRALTKIAVPILVSLVIAAAYLWAKGQTQLVHPVDWLNAFLAFYAIQQLAYTTVLRGVATWVEKAGVQAKARQDDEPKHSL